MKKWLVSVLLILGGVMVFFSLNGHMQKQKEEMQQHELETSIAKWLVSDYKGVEEIKFVSWKQSRETGMWRTTVMINKTNKMSLSFASLSSLAEISGGYSHPDTFKLSEKEFVKDRESIRYRLTDINEISLDGIKISHYVNRETK